MKGLKIIRYLNKETQAGEELTMAEAIKKMRSCFQYPKSNERIFNDIQRIMTGAMLQSARHGFARIDDDRMQPDPNKIPYMTAEDAFEAYKYAGEIRAEEDVQVTDFGAVNCVKILDKEGNQLALLHPRAPLHWKNHFNNLVANQ